MHKDFNLKPLFKTTVYLRAKCLAMNNMIHILQYIRHMNVREAVGNGDVFRERLPQRLIYE
jgi:hypothetical protein